MKITPENVHTVLPSGYRMKVNHYHEGNDPDGYMRHIDGKNKRYVTTAMIVQKKNAIHKKGSPYCLGYGQAVCHEKDSPNRKLGWQIAAGRAFADYMGQIEDGLIS